MNLLCRSVVTFFVIFTSTVSWAATARIYHIGNSLTDQVRYGYFQQAAQAKGNTHTYGRHMLPGAPCNFLWEQARDGGFSEEPFGLWPNALTNYEWDFVTLQPFSQGRGSELQAVNDFYNYALKKSPNMTLCIHMAWPGTNDPKFYDAAWEDPSENGVMTRNYFEYIIDAAQAAHPLQNKVRAIPMGEVMLELNKKIKVGQMPGITNISQIYNDEIHLGEIGSYIVMATHYAVIYQDDPVGLQTTGYNLTAAQALVVQATVRDVVLRYTRTQVKSLGPYPVAGVTVMPITCELNTGRTALAVATFKPVNATLRGITWSSSATGVATVSSSGLITAVGAGSCAVVATTSDGGFKDTCLVAVLASGTPVDGVTIAPDSASVLKGATVALTATVLPSGATNKTVAWTSLDPSVATVSQGGAVSGIAKGRTWIVAQSVNGVKSDTIALRVRIPNNPPIAVISANTVSSVAPVTIRFSARGSSDPDAATGDFILGYDWDYGDGSLVEYWVSPAHTFTIPGTYNVRLRVLDDNDTRSSWDTIVVTVRKPDSTLYCYEPFDYAVDRQLQGNHGGQGFSAQWEVQNQDTILPGFSIKSSSAMTWTGQSSKGGYVSGGRAYLGCGRVLNVTDTTTASLYPNVTQNKKLGKPGTVIWMSALVRKERADDEQTGVSLDGGGTNRVGVGCFGTESNNGGKRYWSLKVGSTVYRSTTEVVAGQTALLAAKIEFGTGSTTVSLYVNPSSIGGTAPSSAGVSQSAGTAMQFTDIAFDAGNSAGASSIDELRIGPTFASVTPAGAAVSSQPVGMIMARAMIGPSIGVHAGVLRIDGLTPGTAVEVCNAAGRGIVLPKAGVGGLLTIDLNRGVYFVRLRNAGMRVAKLVVVP